METQSLAMLIELATTARDGAAARHAQLQLRVQQAREQLDLLRNYACDYVQRSQAQMIAGCDPAAQLNWRAFALKLDQAIAAQTSEVQAREQQLAAGEDELQQARRKLKSLQTLAERRQAAAQQIAQRLDQKQTDELAQSARSPLSTTEW
jgi:flagellar export protein FliJ